MSYNVSNINEKMFTMPIDEPYDNSPKKILLNNSLANFDYFLISLLSTTKKMILNLF